MLDTLLQVEHLSKCFRSLPVLEDINFSINRGEVVGLIGPNGSGKTVLFNCLTGLIKNDLGKLYFNGQDITALCLIKRNRLGISATFQNTRLFHNMSVIENLILGCSSSYLASSSFFSYLFGKKARNIQKAIIEKAHNLLQFVNLEKYASYKPSDLPCGVQRSIEIAKALSTSPQLLLLDEPAAGMNIEERYFLIELIEKIQRSGTSILVVEHDICFISKICHRIIILNNKKKIADSTPSEICKNPEVIKIYLGKI